MATDPWGIEAGFEDVGGRWHATPEPTRAALRAAMGADPADPLAPPPDGRPVSVVRSGDEATVEDPGALTLEDGTVVPVERRLPPDLPLGYHTMQTRAGDLSRLIVTPGRCHLPPDLHAWGVAVQLYAARSQDSWGMGDLGDLAELVRWSTGHGAGVVALNPLHAAAPLPHQEPSPYFPSSRRWVNPLYLRIEDVPGAAALPGLARLAAAGRSLSGTRIDRDAVWRLKLDALEQLWERSDADPRFDRFQREHGHDLRQYATYCALAEHHGTGWRTWPAEHRRPDDPAVARFAAAHTERIAFHAWLQWLLDEQLAAAGADDVVIADLAVGVDPDGADAWQWQDVFAEGVRVGAPPDEFNTQGQDWGLPPFIPWRLRDAGYEPFVATIRAGLRRARGIRIDHVMGLFRLFWIPPDAGPDAGGYVRQPAHDLLDIVALESVRAGAFVVGEDLGTIEDDVRRALHDAGVLSYQLLLFEDAPPARWKHQALAAATTHDLATLTGLWTGADLEAQRRLDLQPNEAGTHAMRDHVRDLCGLADDAPSTDALVAAHQALAQAPSMIVTATLDDLLGAEERPNMPGTTDEWPNWSIPLPAPIDDLDAQPLVTPIVEALKHGRQPLPAREPPADPA
ncbi:MAG: 4-alpha-glucanotransferase [Acidimicrobiales bacterium]|nr:4-alpha-glucanotransferase [Acidimicrobiales bacterium]